MQGLLSTLAIAITTGSALGATIAGFFAYRQKSLVTLLRESNKDYKDRVEQLEEERENLKKMIDDLNSRVKAMEQEKALPLEELTKLIIEQHTQQIKSTDKTTKELGALAKIIAQVAREINKSQDRRSSRE